jgi:hypothetical protein
MTDQEMADDIRAKAQLSKMRAMLYGKQDY